MVGGNIVGQAEGTTDVVATYTDPMGNSRSVTFTVTVAYFPLSADVVNPSIIGTGTFTEKTGGLKTAKDGFGGWVYTNGADFSAYNYLVVTLLRASAAKPTFRLYDSTNNNSDFYTIDMKTPTTTVAIDLKNLVTPKGRVMSPSKIYKAGFSSNGSSALYIKDVFLSMDGETPALGIEEQMVNGKSSNSKSIYNLQGQRQQSLQRGINIIDGKKVFVR